jgi:hypothetical protein
VDVVQSKNAVPIRLTDERWEHIVSNKEYMESRYDDVLRAIDHPTMILRGYNGSLVAVLNLSRNSFLHVVYREVKKDDGFVITAFIARTVNRSQKIWP